MRFVAVDRDWPDKPGFQSLSAEAERLFWRIMIAGDAHGCHRAEPVHLMSLLDVICSSKALKGWLDELRSSGLVAAWEHEGRWWVEIIDYDEHQTERMIAGRPERNAPIMPVTALKVVIPDDAPENKVGPIVTKALEAKAQLFRDTVAVFDHWASVEAETGGIKSAKLTDGRCKRIVARLNEGYSVERLKACIDGYLADPFYLGTKPGAKARYTGLDTIMLNGERVERGEAMAQQVAAKAETSERFSEYDKVGV